MVYILVANGFEESELIVPADILRRGGLDVRLVGVQGSEATSTRGITIKTDICLDDLIIYELDMLVIPGGQPGVDNLWADERVKTVVRAAAAAGKTVGAICAAPMILGRLGLLEGKRAVCYPGCEADLKGAVIAEDCGTVQDGTFITAKGAGCAFSFGFALLAAAAGEECAASSAARSSVYVSV